MQNPDFDLDADAYRRRIRVRTVEPGVVVSELEDDFHHFIVTLRHDGERVLSAAAESRRWPWATCPDATVPLGALAGMPLSRRFTAAGGWTDPRQNCTHQFDAACHAITHAASGRRDRACTTSRCRAATRHRRDSCSVVGRRRAAARVGPALVRDRRPCAAVRRRALEGRLHALGRRDAARRRRRDRDHDAARVRHRDGPRHAARRDPTRERADARHGRHLLLDAAGRSRRSRSATSVRSATSRRSRSACSTTDARPRFHLGEGSRKPAPRSRLPCRLPSRLREESHQREPMSRSAGAASAVVIGSLALLASAQTLAVRRAQAEGAGLPHDARTTPT